RSGGRLAPLPKVHAQPTGLEIAIAGQDDAIEVHLQSGERRDLGQMCTLIHCFRQVVLIDDVRHSTPSLREGYSIGRFVWLTPNASKADGRTSTFRGVVPSRSPSA